MLNKMKSAFGGNKIFKSLLLGVFAVFLFAGSSFASTSVRLQTPPSQVNTDTFTLTFVALDTDSGQAITVKCFKSGPSDGGAYSQFGVDYITSAGGNTSTCNVNSGIINQGIGIYKFYVTADGSSSVSTQGSPVSVDYNNSQPGTPVHYSKEKPDACIYKINFRTADDGGKTVKVVLYRSLDPNFTLDASHVVNTINILSSTDGSMTDNINPHCSNAYVYALRAFDAYGNGSGVVGDSNITTTVVNPTTTTQQSAIPVSGGGSSVLGEDEGVSEETTSEETKEVLGEEETPSVVSEQNPVSNLTNWILGHKKVSLLVLVLLGAIGYYLYRRYKK